MSTLTDAVKGVSFVAGAERAGSRGTLVAITAASGRPLEPTFGLLELADLEEPTAAVWPRAACRRRG